MRRDDRNADPLDVDAQRQIEEAIQQEAVLEVRSWPAPTEHSHRLLTMMLQNMSHAMVRCPV